MYLLVRFEDRKIEEVVPYSPLPFTGIASTGVFFCKTSKAGYIKKVNRLLEHIHRGDIYEINYCIEFYAENVVLDVEKVFNDLKEFTGAPYAGLYQYDGQIIICASPERFIKRQGNLLVSQPMKGTAPRGSNAEEDLILRKGLAGSLKEQTENVMAVDVTRNDLSQIAERGTVVTSGLFDVHTFKNVHQMVSTVECKLRENVDVKEILEATFPPASMTGAPKIKACELIAKYELSPRGIYSGCIGQMNSNGDLDLCVVIRTLIYDPVKRTLSFHVGSAITAAADPSSEWEECLLKAEALLRAVGSSMEQVQFIETEKAGF